MTSNEKYMGKLEGKIALVTGGNSGIGLATAKQFVNEGAYAFRTGRREAELAPTGHKIHFETVDVMRVRNGKITDHWGVANLLSLMQQLGLGPALDLLAFFKA